MDQCARLFTAPLLIFTKATCDNMADAEWGFKSLAPDGGPRTLLAAPLTPWTCVSNMLDREWLIWNIKMFPPRWVREKWRQTEARRDAQTYSKGKLCFFRISHKNKTANPPPVWTSRHQIARDLLEKTADRWINNNITSLTLPEIVIILMRHNVTVNKALLFFLLVSQTISLTFDPCCDLTRRRRTIPQGCTAVELSDVLI